MSLGYAIGSPFLVLGFLGIIFLFSRWSIKGEYASLREPLGDFARLFLDEVVVEMEDTNGLYEMPVAKGTLAGDAVQVRQLIGSRGIPSSTSIRKNSAGPKLILEPRNPLLKLKYGFNDINHECEKFHLENAEDVTALVERGRGASLSEDQRRALARLAAIPYFTRLIRDEGILYIQFSGYFLGRHALENAPILKETLPVF